GRSTAMPLWSVGRVHVPTSSGLKSRGFAWKSFPESGLPSKSTWNGISRPPAPSLGAVAGPISSAWPVGLGLLRSVAGRHQRLGTLKAPEGVLDLRPWADLGLRPNEVDVPITEREDGQDGRLAHRLGGVEPLLLEVDDVALVGLLIRRQIP